MSRSPRRVPGRHPSLARRLGIALLLPLSLLADPGNRRSYELPAGDAAATLRQLAAISGREILFAAEAVRGVRTNAVRGEFTALEAAGHLLAGTALFVAQDEKTGALAVYRQKFNATRPRRE